MFTCDYDFIEIGVRGNAWVSGCNKPILYIAPLGQGVATPPLPTDNGATFCTFCGKKIKLKSLEPRKQMTMPRPPKPEPAPRPVKVLEIGKSYDTYDGWKDRGFQVQRREKSIGRSAEGLTLFHVKQVGAMTPKPGYFPQVDDGDDFADWDEPF